MINYWEKGSWNFRKNFHFLYASGCAPLNSSLFLVLSHATAFFSALKFRLRLLLLKHFAVLAHTASVVLCSRFPTSMFHWLNAEYSSGLKDVLQPHSCNYDSLSIRAFVSRVPLQALELNAVQVLPAVPHDDPVPGHGSGMFSLMHEVICRTCRNSLKRA